jgi:peptide-methionine (S)-S-oxide reductase
MRARVVPGDAFPDFSALDALRGAQENGVGRPEALRPGWRRTVYFPVGNQAPRSWDDGCLLLFVNERMPPSNFARKKKKIFFAMARSSGGRFPDPLTCVECRRRHCCRVGPYDHSTEPDMATEIATLGGGCFWCTEAVYQELKGISLVESGYTGGAVVNPSYEQICTGSTGHAEVVRLTFDPDVISYRTILEIFFTIHDPTTLNRQGNDTGTQYRSVIYFHDAAQQDTAKHVIAEMANVWDGPIVTELSPVETFYKAENYHQNYFRNNPNQGYCAFIVAPKVTKLRKMFSDRLKG